MNASANSSIPHLGGPFQLTDHHGCAVSEARFRGRYALLFFGFTHCQVVCPRTLAALTRAIDRLGPMADRIQGLYVTVDPERDTPAVLRDYLTSRYPRFLGLTGSKKEIESIKATFRVYAGRAGEGDAGRGVIRHSALAYVIDPEGLLVDHWPAALGEDEIFHRIEQALQHQ